MKLSLRFAAAILSGAAIPLMAATALGAPVIRPPSDDVRAAPAPPPRTDFSPMQWQFGVGQPKTTVVFMHGLGGSPEHYGPLLKDLLAPQAPTGFAAWRAPAEGAVKVVAPWMRSPGTQHTMTDQLARARAVIDATPGPVVLVGHSFGGKAAVKLAAEYPLEKVPAVVTLAPSVNMLQSFWKRATGEAQLPPNDVVEERLAHAEKALTERLGALGPRADKEEVADLRGQIAQLRFMRDLAKNDERGTETHVTTPTLVLHGTEDEAVSIHYARRFAGANPASVKLVELPGVKHDMDTRGLVPRGAVKKTVAAFLDANKAPGAPAQAAR